MSFNIIDLVKGQIGDQLLGQMGSLLGDESTKASSAMDSIIPSLLGGITSTASTTQGADSLFSAVQDQDDSLLDNIGSMLGGGQASSVIDNGNSLLGTLLGSGALGKLVGAVSGFTGVSKSGSSSLMGILAPIVIGALKRKVLGDGLNAGTLASLLGSQKSNIAAAMPQGLGDQLNSSGFLSSLPGVDSVSDAFGGIGATASNAVDSVSNVAGGVGDAVGNVGDAVGNVAGNVGDAVGNVAGNVGDAVGNAAGNVGDAVGNAAGNVGDAVSNVADNVGDAAGSAVDTVTDGAKQGGSMFRWLLPLIVLALLGWLAFKFLLGGGTEVSTTGAADAVTETTAEATEAASSAVSTATETATEAASDMKDKASDAVSAVTEMADISPDAIGEKLTGIFGSTTEALSGITDADSATAALPKLGEIGTNLSGVTDMMEKLPDAARGPIAKMASESMGSLEPIMNNVMSLPGVGKILEPVLGPIMETLQSFGG